MHIILDKPVMRFIISFASFRPVVVPITYEQGDIQEEEIQIDPWSMMLQTRNGKFNLKIENDTANQSKDVAWLWQ